MIRKFSICCVGALYLMQRRLREGGTVLRGMKKLRLHALNSFSCEPALAARQCRGKQTICYASVHNGTDANLRRIYHVVLVLTYNLNLRRKWPEQYRYRRIYSSVSLGSEKSVQSGRIDPRRGTSLPRYSYGHWFVSSLSVPMGIRILR